MKTLILAALLCALLALDTAQGQCPFRPKCPSGWIEFCDRCYTYAPKYTSWDDAQKNCQSLGGHLASVRDAEEYGVIQKLISDSKGFGPAWIGGSVAKPEGSWFWIYGDKFKYTNWAPGQPDNFGGVQHCLQMNHGDAKLWDDLNCQTPLPSICAKYLY
ncbi:ladderlectin-like [Mastacembelus armatus]|uniref:Ladderlectin-like n=1 Tax=Mastacembelus armatus TaxID=205130 RepID=A0A7N8YC18_9TELE|nr:ladderlectin-like [Mastacembelus armatus]